MRASTVILVLLFTSMVLSQDLVGQCNHDNKTVESNNSKLRVKPHFEHVG
jgi:hypothetical protein